ncbi:MAG TPA: rhodanese-like domain-containing protein, partial [Pirellulaceae bacterium]|nr:rhodanese-like domain-containing protein [Pirellulaceae bacterium]
ALSREFDPCRYLNTHSMGESGMTIDDLLQAVREMELEGCFFRHLSTAALASCPHPVILNVSSSRGSDNGHWVTYAGFENGEFLLFDNSRCGKIVTMRHGELQSVWSGKAILCSAENVAFAAWKMRLTSLLAIAPLLLIALVGAMFAKHVSRINVVIMFLGTFASMTWWHATVDSFSMVSNWDAARWLASSPSIRQCPPAELRELKLALLDEHVIIVDAQPPAAFARCHLRNAINLPIGVDLPEFRARTSTWSRERPLIVLCGSIGCGWADQIANLLVDFGGFKDVKVYRPGVQGLLDLGWDADCIGVFRQLRRDTHLE